MAIRDILQPVTFGERVAEEELERLAKYFVETDHWQRLFSDSVDIVYGPKGAGKSALYSLLVGRKSELFDRRILTVAAENPRGATAFKALVTDPPATEQEFTALWKLYMACLISATLDDFGVSTPQAKELRERLQASGLRPTEKNLQTVLLSAFGYVKRRLRPKGVEGGVNLDPITGTPTGVTGKILFGEPSQEESASGSASVDRLLELGDEALGQTGYKLWVLLDRLDVAFSDSAGLEQNALRALFHVYLDLLALQNFRLKIFLRTDIWRRITTTGFREASHITRHMTIEWNKASMLNLVVRRAAENASILAHFGETKPGVLASSESQERFFYQIFPDQVEAGPRKPNSLDWMLGRTCDASRQPAPREVIHLLNALRNAQVRRLENGEADPEAGRLFSRAVFREALPEVSKTRLEQTLYAEYPEAREHIESMRREKTQHTTASLSRIWKVDEEGALKIARDLSEIGFLEQRGDKDNPIFWVPLLYRDGLELVQGASD